MKDFKSGGFTKSFGDRGDRGGFGGKPSFGGNRGGFDRGDRPSFGKKPWDKGGRDVGDKQMFSATCASCGKQCQVPFKPVDGRPVYCNDCFGSNRDEGANRGGSDRSYSSPAPRRDFNSHDRNDRPSFSPKQAPDNRIDGVSKQLEKVSMQLDQLIGMMKQSVSNQPAQVRAVENSEVKAPSTKSVAAMPKPVSKPAAKSDAKKAAPAKKVASKKVSKKK